MLVITRRALLKIAGGVSSLMGGMSARAAQAPTRRSTSPAIFHVFAFQWNDGVGVAQQKKARAEILAFQGVIPGLLETHVGPNLSSNGQGFTFGGIMRFADQASLDAYAIHPAHQRLLKWLVPLIRAIELDLGT